MPKKDKDSVQLYKTLDEYALSLSAKDLMGWASKDWVKNSEERAQMTMACRDSDYIPKVKDAGQTKVVAGKKVQVMHNGLLVEKNGYQGEWESKIIQTLRGHHEPQEEKVFYEVLRRIGRPTTMIELGSWWSYYSMWYVKETGGRAVCCEPDKNNLKLGQTNVRLNKLEQAFTFKNVALGSEDGFIEDFVNEAGHKVGVSVRSVDSIIEQENIKKVDILHLDIQGHEVEALKGAAQSIKKDIIRFVFISTHHYAIAADPALHQKCIELVKNWGAHIISSHTILQSTSGDGLIVASFDPRDKDFTVQVSFQSTDDSLHREAEVDTAILWDAHDQLIAQIEKLKSNISDYNHEREELLLERNSLNAKLAEIENRSFIVRLKEATQYGLIRAKTKVARVLDPTPPQEWVYDDTALSSGDSLERLSLSEELSLAFESDNKSFAVRQPQESKIKRAVYNIAALSFRIIVKVLRTAYRLSKGRT